MTAQLPRRRTDLTVQITSEEAHLTDLATGKTHVLNASAYAIWELCDGQTEPVTMAEAVAEVTDIDVDQAQQQIRDTIEVLREKGLVD